ncbi:hypothetical protein [Pseudochryseolinea flava]|uniref:Uncharacterized protein n=1 Tax=Pseudochryseolinea flava TaxID=2059302 RepID=A0A364XZ06_9BACT|nr:hypothetical protein [Pseudochryseolinea flava]RAV99576.1 hypothetical protein DQQ10_18425 [Pseudochryseolinea flava]
MKFIYPLLLFLAASATPALSQDLCKTKVDFEVKEISKGSFEISLKSSRSISQAQVKLYDLYSGKVIQEKTVVLSSNPSLFRNVKSSRYTVLITFEGCSKGISVGGIEGIKVGEL